MNRRPARSLFSADRGLFGMRQSGRGTVSMRAEAQEEAFASLARSAVASGRDKHAAPFGGMLSLAMFAAVAVFVLLSLALGAQAYGGLAKSRSDVSSLREGSSLLLNSVRAVDTADAVSVGDGPEGRALVLVEHLDSGDFETRFYLYDGQVLQEYAVSGLPYAPERASVVDKSSVFDFSCQDGLLRVTVDSGTTVVALRCAESGA